MIQSSSHPIIQSSVTGQRWVPRLADPQQERLAIALSQQQGLHEVVARLLVGRGIAPEDAHDFLHPTLKACLPDPSHLHDMEKATARIARAIASHEKIAVFGDYDVDGATSSALLKRYFAALGIEVLIYIPDRMKEGYGPTVAAFDLLAAQGVTLILTVDCGTVSLEPIAHAKAKGIDVIVIDHHQALPQLPDAAALVNPNRIDQDSNCRIMAAVGVVFLVLVALNRHLRGVGWFDQQTVAGSKQERSRRDSALSPLHREGQQTAAGSKQEPNLLQWLDLVALGTVCDVVPLTGVNRALVSQGLKVLAQRANPGLAAIADVAHLDETPSAYHLGFLIGPRINAGGRVGESALGSQILAQDDPILCRDMAERLDAYNAERQAIEASVLDAALRQAEHQANQPCILVHAEGWHEGVIGIVAGRLKEKFQRPSMVLSVKEGVAKGSARSVSGADIGAAIASAKSEGIIMAGGGHSMAAGCTLAADAIGALDAFIQQRLAAAVSRYQEARAYVYDAAVSAGGLTLELAALLELAGHYGAGHPAPRLMVPSARIARCDRMKDKHLRAYIADGSSKKTVVAVAFNAVGTPLGEALEGHAGRSLHLAGTLKRNLWQGQESVQLMLEDAALA